MDEVQELRHRVKQLQSELSQARGELDAHATAQREADDADVSMLRAANDLRWMVREALASAVRDDGGLIVCGLCGCTTTMAKLDWHAGDCWVRRATAVLAIVEPTIEERQGQA